VTLNVDFKVTEDALNELCVQLTRDLFAIAKFLLHVVRDRQTGGEQRLMPHYQWEL